MLQAFHTSIFNCIFRNVQYIERDGAEHFHTLSVFPETMMKKVTLLKYFRNYMSEHLLKVIKADFIAQLAFT